MALKSFRNLSTLKGLSQAEAFVRTAGQGTCNLRIFKENNCLVVQQLQRIALVIGPFASQGADVANTSSARAVKQYDMTRQWDRVL